MLEIDKFLEKLPEGDRLEFRAAWHSELAAHLDGEEKVRPKQGEHDPAFRAVLILESLLGELKETKKQTAIKCDFKMWCSFIVDLGLRNLPSSSGAIQRAILNLEIKATEAKLRDLQAIADHVEAKEAGKNLVSQAIQQAKNLRDATESEVSAETASE